MLAFESAMDELATALNIDPVELRLRMSRRFTRNSHPVLDAPPYHLPSGRRAPLRLGANGQGSRAPAGREGN